MKISLLSYRYIKMGAISLRKGNVAHDRGNWRPKTDQVTIERVRGMFKRDLKLSIRQASETLNISIGTIYRFLCEPFPCFLTNPKITKHCWNLTKKASGICEALSNTSIWIRWNLVLHFIHWWKHFSAQWYCELAKSENLEYQMPNWVNPFLMAWCAISKQRLTDSSFFKDKNVAGGSYRKIHINYGFSRFNHFC